MDYRATEIGAFSRAYDISIELPKSSFKISWTSPLGSSEFGYVYKAYLEIEQNLYPIQVAVKLAKDKCSKTMLMSILSEIKILLYLGKHKNIVPIKGA